MDAQMTISAPLATKVPTVTVTSFGDASEGENEMPEIIREKSEEKGNAFKTEREKQTRPKHLNVGALAEDVTSASEPAKIGNISKAVSCPVTPVDDSMDDVSGLHLNIARPRSVTSLTNPALLSPGSCGTDYESDVGSSSLPMTDYEDNGLPRDSKILNLINRERADSDTAVTSTPKKGKKALKNIRSSFRGKVTPSSPSKSKKFTENGRKKGAVEELAIASMKVDTDQQEGNLSKSENKENEKRKRRKLKSRKSKSFSRMAQKFSDRQVLSPSYKQKNEAFHKFFKDLPSSERLLVDYTCAMVKDILVQGRLYVSQNYLCFHSNILKWQTAVTVKLVDIDQMTKEKTVKVIPNAIQILMKDKTKITFTSFTARDRAYLTTFRLWQNALLDKPMTAHELWTQIHSNYGEELGLCSSDDDYVRPDNMPRKHQSFGEGDSDMKYEFGTTNKVKRKKKLTNSTQTPPDGELEKLNRRDSKSNKSSSSARHSSQDSCHQFQQGSDSDDKSIHSSQCSREDISLADDVIQDEDDDEEDFSVDVSRSRKNSSRIEEQVVEEEENDEPADFTLPDCHKVSLFCIYETSAKDMFRIIFGEENECSFWKDTLVNKGTTQIEFGRWGDDEEVKGQKIRHLAYTLRLDNPIGPKTSHCKEKQILYASTVEGKSYGIDCIVQNYGIPYADYFYTCMRYCIRKVTKNKCEVRVTSELRYKKTPWGLVKNFIEKNVASGLTQNFTKLTWQLRNQVENEKSQPQIEDNKSRQNGNVRRRKRRSETGKDGLKSKGSRSSSSLSNENQRGQSSQKDRNDLNNNKGSLTPSGDATPGVPSMRMPNGYIPSSRPYDTESPKLHYFGQGGKFIIGAILFIFVLLIYSNYSMYQRLTTLEQVTAAAATADGVDPSVTAALLDRPGVPISSNPEMMSTYLRAIDKRLRRLEDSMVKFAETSGAKWEKMEKDWASLQKMLQTILQHKMTNGA